MSIIDTIWSPTNTISLQRWLWVEIAQHHMRAGLMTAEDHDCYRHAASLPVNLERIRRRERVLRHDLKASLEEFDYISGGFGKLHLGCTSADIVENVYCIQMRQSAEKIMEMLDSSDDRQILAEWIASYPMRGIKGAVGSMQDQIDLIGRDAAMRLDIEVAHAFGFPGTLGAIGQVAPRSLDFQACNTMLSYLTLDRPARLILAGYSSMLADIATTQWNEGDVSSSVVRRVALPGFWRTIEQSIQRQKATK